jgi:hypothetical protein
VFYAKPPPKKSKGKPKKGKNTFTPLGRKRRRMADATADHAMEEPANLEK